MAVVNSFIAFFNAIQSAIEYVREILAIIDDYVATMAAVARGDVEPGAARLEQGLISAIPVAIGFLANQVGLGNVGDKIEEIIGGLRAMVDRALDWLLDQAERLLASVMRTLGLGDEGEEPSYLDVREQAREQIGGRLGGEFSEEDARTAIARVLEDLRELGLQELRLGPERDDGAIPVLATASPTEELLALAPPRRRVRAVIEIEMLGTMPHLAGAEGLLRGREVVRDEHGRPVRDEEGDFVFRELPPSLDPTTTAGPSRAASKLRSGGVAVPGTGSVLEVVTWNTGELDPRVQSNATHAEEQFVQWFLRQGAAWRERVEGIRIEVHDLSPCVACIEGLVRVHQHAPELREAKISWGSLYTKGVWATTNEALRRLSSVGWEYEGPTPGAGPAGDPVLHVVR
jgi:hypothetical protein